ncbi:MAG: sigma-70 family RNA polymerase sigma factor [Clostridium sp.]|nr:sigma-70 family RNA polymerase sigma factor [Clostridium sp.]MDU7084503.1 sigma-70 family RNA polymerase sigma factor [Clostridium sp.]
MEINSHGTWESIEEIINKYSDMVYRLALARTKNITDAEDIFQEVFIRLIKNIDKLHGEDHIKPWLIKVTINCSKTLLTSSWFKRTVPLEDTLKFSTPEKTSIYYAVLDLPIKYRTVIYLFYYEDLSINEISETLKTKESTVKSQLSRGRNLLKKILKGEDFHV